MTVNFVFDKFDTVSNLPVSNITSSFYENWNDGPYWYQWGCDINKHLLTDWDNTDEIIMCELTSKSWDLYARRSVLTNTSFLITVEIKLGTATNCNISIIDSGSWTFLGGESFNANEHLSTSNWTKVNIEMLPSKSGIIHLHIGALDNQLATQQEGTVFIKNLKIKYQNIVQRVNDFSCQNGRFSASIQQKSRYSSILLSEIDNYKHDFNIYPITITTAEYKYCWPLLLLSKKIVDLVNTDQLKILLICSFEPMAVPNANPTDHLLSSIHQQVSTICGLQRIKKISNIIFAASDSSIEKRLAEYKKEMINIDHRTPLIKFKDINAYGHITPQILKSSNSIDWLEVYCNSYHNNKTYVFLYLNNRVVYHRYAFYKCMEYKNLLQYGLYSWNGFLQTSQHTYNPFNEFCSNVDPYAVESKQNFINYVKSNPDIEIKKIPDDTFDIGFDPLVEGSQVNQSWIANTYFSIVTETHVGQGPSHVTEKIYKLIFCCHPFIIIGPRYHLATLHRYGFKTFPEMFDESYDSMLENFEKHNFISEQIKFYTTYEGKKKLQQIFPILRDTLEYNRNHLLALSSNDLWNSLEDLYKNN